MFKSSKDQDFTPIWKRTVTIGNYQIKIDPEHAKLIGNRPEARIEKSKSPLEDYYKRKLLPVMTRDVSKFDFSADAATSDPSLLLPKTQFEINKERDKVLTQCFTQIMTSLNSML